MDQCNIPGHEHQCFPKRFSFMAIFVGALVGVGLSFLLNLFSVAIGLSMIKTTQEGATTLAIGGLIGLLIGAIVAMFVAGFAAGYLGRPCCPKRNMGVLYGFSAWCLALLLTALFAAQVGQYAAAYANFVANPTYVAVNANANTTTVSTDTSTTTADTEKTVNTLGMGTLIIFILFFVGALSSCFGGHFGMGCSEECRTKKM